MTNPLQPTPITDELKLFRGILYGDFGQGKTTLAGQIVQALGGKTLDVTADSCWTVLEGVPGIERIQFKSYGRGTTFGMFEDIGKQYGDGLDFQNLILDPVSTMVDISRRHWTAVKKFNDQRDEDVSSWTHYNLVRDKFADAVAGKGATRLTPAVQGLGQTKLNILYLCHLRQPPEEEAKKGKILKRPSMPEATYSELAKECNFVGFCHKIDRGQKYMIQTEGTLSVAAKSQIPTIPQTTLPQEQIPDLLRKWREQ